MSDSDSAYDLEAVRADFPILSRRVHGKPLVYLDNGASAQKPRAVLDAITRAYENEYANVHRGLHFLSNAATDAYEAARKKVQAFLGAEHADEIIFTSGTTESVNLVAYGWAMAHLQKGDEIVLSIAEHHSNIVPWHFLRERFGVKLVFADCDDQGQVSVDSVLGACSSRTKLIALAHMSNVTGAVIDAQTICKEARAKGIITLLDGSQYAVHKPVDVRAIGCDFYCMTGHKLYGPSGIGVLYGKKEMLADMRPFQGGGEMIETVTLETVEYNEPPHRFEAGTPPIVQAIGLGAALDYMESIGRDKIEAHENRLRDYARKRLKDVNSLRLTGDSDDKGAIFSFEMEGVHPHDISMMIDREGIAVRAGTHCAQPLLNRFGTTATCRASFALYNPKSEVDALVDALQSVRKFFHDR